MFAPFAYALPSDLRQASKNLQGENAYLYAGGTDLMSCLRDHVFPVDSVVSMKGLSGLKGIQQTSGGMVIGALTTITEIAEDRRVKNDYPVLAQAAFSVASPQIRNQGTIGGNLCQKPRCWYYRGEFDCLRKGGSTCFAEQGENPYHAILGGENCFIVHPSDPLPALVALDATIVARGPAGERPIPAGKFIMDPAEDPTRETTLEPDEVVTEIHIPKLPPGTYSAYRKIRARRSWDFALAGTALVLNMENNQVKDARLVFSGVAPYPWRAKNVEEILTNATLNQAIIQKAARAATQEAKPLAQNAYKIDLLQGTVQDELTKAANAK